MDADEYGHLQQALVPASSCMSTDCTGFGPPATGCMPGAFLEANVTPTSQLDAGKHTGNGDGQEAKKPACTIFWGQEFPHPHDLSILVYATWRRHPWRRVVRVIRKVVSLHPPNPPPGVVGRDLAPFIFQPNTKALERAFYCRCFFRQAEGEFLFLPWPSPAPYVGV